MKKILILAPALAFGLAACDPVEAPAPAPATNVTIVENEGGPCGDGTVLGPDEKCR